MNSTRRRITAFLPAALAATGILGAAAACGTSAGGQTQPAKLKEAASLAYWTVLSGADGTRMQSMTEQYQKEQALVKVEGQHLPDFLTKFVASVVAGTPPDIITIRQTYIAGFVEKNALLDLQPKELQQAGLRAEDFDQTIWKASEYKGKRYTVPFDIHGYQLFYHEGSVRDAGGDPSKPPVTWSDWLDWAARFTQGDRRGAMINFAGAGLVWQYQGFLRQAAKASSQANAQAADLFSADGKKAAFNNAAGNEALSLMADLYRRTNMPLPQGAGFLDLFEQRKLTSVLGGPWNLNRLGQTDNPAFNDLRLALAPQRDVSKPSWWAQSHQIALPKGQKVDDAKRAAAFNFAQWLAEHPLEWAQAGQVPANKKILNSDAFQKSTHPVHKLLATWVKNLPSAGFMQLHPKHVEVEDQLPPILAKAVTGQVSAQSALTDAEQLVNNILSQ